MNIVQKNYINVEKEGKQIQLVVDADTPLGAIFDAFMELKGFCCDKMIAAHAEETAEAERQMGILEEHEELKD